MLVIVLTLVLTGIAVSVSVAAWYQTRSESSEKKTQFFAEGAAHDAVNPLLERIAVIESKLGAESAARDRLVTKGMIGDALDPVNDKLSRLSTQMELMDTFWKSVAGDMAKILHHPDPERARLDLLLDAFTEDTLTTEQRYELKRHLVLIRNWEPGVPAPYNIHPGEQTAAAILLKSIILMEREEAANA